MAIPKEDKILPVRKEVVLKESNIRLKEAKSTFTQTKIMVDAKEEKYGIHKMQEILNIIYNCK